MITQQILTVVVTSNTMFAITWTKLIYIASEETFLNLKLLLYWNEINFKRIVFYKSSSIPVTMLLPLRWVKLPVVIYSDEIQTYKLLSGVSTVDS